MPSVPRLSLVLPLVFTVLAAWVPSPASAQPVTAIVNARIVDGSGNEPFVGTVVIEGGRIRAAGRSVEVPAGAVTIDGAGRTVLPGLVDVRLKIDAAGPNAVARALAAALHGGVTTAAIAGLTPERMDAVRPLAARSDSGPRVTIVGDPQTMRSGAQALLVAPGVTGAEAAAADARSRGQRVVVDAAADTALDRVLALEPNLIVGAPSVGQSAAQLAQRNVTVALDAPTAETVRLLREAHVRLALSGIVAPAGARGGVPALVEAGATPLDAVTAATSGGAWALGAQSDRGFLAPGMRADLLIVRGDPTTTPADLQQVDRVFLGGVEVDREALAAKIREFDTPPPAPTPAVETAAKTPETARKPEPTSRRRGRERKPAKSDTPPSTAETAPVPATPTPAPTPTEPAPTPTPAPVAPAPAPDAPAAAPTPAVAGAPRLEDPLIDDFERSGNGGDSLGSWTSGSSEGAAPATIVMGRVVRGLRDHALHLTARMGQGSAPFVRAAIPLSSDGGPMDVSRFRGIRFDARGEGRYRVVFVTRSITDGRYHESYFSGSPLWTPVGIPFASVGQNGRGGQATFTGRDLIEIRFEVARDPGQMAWLELDNLRFY